MTEELILESIACTEEISFNEFCRALKGDVPTERSEWADLFRMIEKLERDHLVTVDRLDGRIESLILTEAGAERVRDKFDSRRGLLGLL